MTLKELYEQIGGDYEQALRVLRMDKLIDKHIRKLPAGGVADTLIAAGGTMDPTQLFETAHAVVKMTREHSKHNPNRGCLKVEFTFPKKYPLELMKQLFRDETLEVAAYLATRKTNTLWTNN